MKKKFAIEVDCANCAAKMQQAVSRLEGVDSVSVNYMTQRFTLEAEDSVFETVLKKAVKAMKRVEPDFSITL